MAKECLKQWKMVLKTVEVVFAPKTTECGENVVGGWMGGWVGGWGGGIAQINSVVWHVHVLGASTAQMHAAWGSRTAARAAAGMAATAAASATARMEPCLASCSTGGQAGGGMGSSTFVGMA